MNCSACDSMFRDVGGYYRCKLYKTILTTIAGAPTPTPNCSYYDPAPGTYGNCGDCYLLRNTIGIAYVCLKDATYLQVDKHGCALRSVSCTTPVTTPVTTVPTAKPEPTQRVLDLTTVPTLTLDLEDETEITVRLNGADDE